MSFSDQVVATPDPPSKGVHNPIHDAQGTDAAGYAGALVAGVRTYGWAVQTIVSALGAQWRSSGWVDVQLRRPLYAEETLTTNVSGNGNTVEVSCEVTTEKKVVMNGTAGMGIAPWVSDLTPPNPAPPGETNPPLPTYLLDTAPLNKPLVPLGAWVTNATAQDIVVSDLGLDDPHYSGTANATPIHPYFIAGRMAPLTRHNFTYGPTIHVRSQIQNVREALSDRQIVVGAQIVDVYERKGHWYQVLDGVVTDEDGLLAKIRHHTIFRPRLAP
ncbi:MAG: hypothetical protein GKR90_01290 [Pseudomonadales bacterium]|nr:hypothetical protein [Pseudomonadales bacterium]